MAFWIGFFVLVSILIFADLFLNARVAHRPTFRESLRVCSFFVSIGIGFSVVIWLRNHDVEKVLEYLTGYIVELSLSMDNVFVFALIFKYFNIDVKFQHRILFWGVVGAIIMRLLMITFGIVLIHKFEWVFYIFGAILVYSAYVLLFKAQKDEVKEGKADFITFVSKFMPVVDEYKNGEFFLRKKGKLHATTLFVALLFIEKSDLIFAIDSVPAILAITQDVFVVFTSNIFAILGIRSLYFLIAHAIDKFYYLHHALALILAFIGVKMILMMYDIKIGLPISLAVIITSITLATIFSLKKARR
jgi:tellurite resistance protein TerC